MRGCKPNVRKEREVFNSETDSPETSTHTIPFVAKHDGFPSCVSSLCPALRMSRGEKKVKMHHHLLSKGETMPDSQTFVRVRRCQHTLISDVPAVLYYW